MFLESSELCISIEECKKEMRTFKMYGTFVDEAIKDIDRLGVIIREVSASNVDEGLLITKKIGSLIGPYSSYVPRIALTIQQAKEWLEASKV